MTKIIYHGTILRSAKDIAENGVNLTIGRKNLDFGQGFYTTEDKEQAIEWAKRKAFNKDIPAVVCLQAEFNHLNVKNFLLQDAEWQKAIYLSLIHI